MRNTTLRYIRPKVFSALSATASFAGGMVVFGTTRYLCKEFAGAVGIEYASPLIAAAGVTAMQHQKDRYNNWRAERASTRAANKNQNRTKELVAILDEEPTQIIEALSTKPIPNASDNISGADPNETLLVRERPPPRDAFSSIHAKRFAWNLCFSTAAGVIYDCAEEAGWIERIQSWASKAYQSITSLFNSISNPFAGWSWNLFSSQHHEPDFINSVDEPKIETSSFETAEEPPVAAPDPVPTPQNELRDLIEAKIAELTAAGKAPITGLADAIASLDVTNLSDRMKDTVTAALEGHPWAIQNLAHFVAQGTDGAFEQDFNLAAELTAFAHERAAALGGDSLKILALSEQFLLDLESKLGVDIEKILGCELPEFINNPHFAVNLFPDGADIEFSEILSTQTVDPGECVTANVTDMTGDTPASYDIPVCLNPDAKEAGRSALEFAKQSAGTLVEQLLTPDLPKPDPTFTHLVEDLTVDHPPYHHLAADLR